MGKSGKDNTLPDPNADICHLKKCKPYSNVMVKVVYQLTGSQALLCSEVLNVYSLIVL